MKTKRKTMLVPESDSIDSKRSTAIEELCLTTMKKRDVKDDLKSKRKVLEPDELSALINPEWFDSKLHRRCEFNADYFTCHLAN